MYPSVTKVSPLEDFTLYIEFSNGENGILDIKPFLHFGVFNRLKKPGEFERVKVSFDTVEWDCGVDLDPEFIYEKCKDAKVA